ncbi:MAG TPA: oligogalacturonate lyase family protein [Opitutales bacterium]|jgi:oligogalacturonide lyase|nr:oligogalacturonate lyase family protein [Opitutales bacterium]
MNSPRRPLNISLFILLPLGTLAFAADTPAPVTSPTAPASPAASPTTAATDNLPTEWIDPDTGHRVVRLSREDNTQSLYFHQNPFTPDGTRLVVTVPSGIATINLKTHEIKQVALGTAPTQRIDTHDSTPADERIGHVVCGRKTPTVYYTKGADVMATNLDTGATRKIGTLPDELFWGAGFTVNADETLLAGSGDANAGPLGAIGPNWTGNQGLPQRMAALVPMVLYTMDIKTGEIKKFFRAEHDWLNHVQFSPTDPKLLMYCHEGTWSAVDRIWQINVTGDPYTVKSDDTLTKIADAHGTYPAMIQFYSKLTADVLNVGQQITLPPTPRLMHERTMDMEIAGHEFWGADGKTAFYDLQTPESGVFWVGGTDVATGQEIRYALQRNEWSVHYNVSPDGKFFAGDGGGPNSVANRQPGVRGALNPPGNGQWIYLFTPDPSAAATIKVGDKDVKTIPFKAERLVNLAKHDYGLEPNVSFSPDMKWIIFRSNMLGADHGSQVFAVEIAKTK